jgi:transcriptional regulator with PAS, ATPase and Fis domain
LNVLQLRIPTLRERKTDIPSIINYFIKELDMDITLTDEAVDMLCEYSWPGNIRQLINIMERMNVVHRGDRITGSMIKELLIFEPDNAIDGEGLKIPFQGTLKDMEITAIEKYLSYFNNNKSVTAKTLGISRSHLWRRINNITSDNYY